MASNEIKHLSEEFLYILYNAAIKKSYLCGRLTENMKSEYLPDKQFQILQRTMALYFKSHKSSPSFGVIKEKLRDDLDTIELIETIADTKYKESDEVIINTLEEYIKDVKLKNLYAKIPQYYNKGQSDKAQEEIKQYAEWMNSFSLNASKFISVIDTFKVRYEENVKTIEEMKQDTKPSV